jgi:integrase
MSPPSAGTSSPASAATAPTGYDQWTRLLQLAGVRHVRLHDGRHTAATLLLSENVHPPGSRSCSATARCARTTDIYSHVMPELAREAADRMGTVLLMRPASNWNQRRSGRSFDGERAAQRVELRGLEPLTPALPEGLRGIRCGAQRFISAGQTAAQSSADRHGQP